MVFLYAAYEGYNSHSEVLLKQISWPLTTHQLIIEGYMQERRACTLGFLGKGDTNRPVKNWPVL